MRTARCYSVSHLDDATLRKEATEFAVGERFQLVQFLVRIAEIDARQLYLRAGYDSMSAYCVEEFGLTEDEALRRLHAARVAREFPLLAEEMDAGRLCLSRVRMLAIHLTTANVHELVEAARRYRRLSDFRHFLDRFTKPDLLVPPPVVSPSVEVALGTTCTESGRQDEGAHSQGRGHATGAQAPFVLSVETPTSPPPDLPEWVDLRIKLRGINGSAFVTC